MTKRTGRAKPSGRRANPAANPVRAAPAARSQSLQKGSSPAPHQVSFSYRLEPVFLLIECDVMEQLCNKAAALGIGGYDSLVKRILREHVGKY